MDSSSTPSRRRKFRRDVYFSHDELSQIAQRMRTHGQTNFSRFARELLCSGIITTTVTASMAGRIDRHLSAIGNNVNQIARQANTDHVATFEMVSETLALLTEVRSLVRRELGEGSGGSQDQGDPIDLR